jgi:uncharacterized protein (DUF427 family)
VRPTANPVLAGQRSVRDLPRPPIDELCSAHATIELAGNVIADTNLTNRTLETSHLPSYYFPSDAIARGVLRRAEGTSFCEWKGLALYWDVVIGDRVLPRVRWSYPDPTPPFVLLLDHIAFYAGPFDRCSVDGETVIAQPGEFYGGWITPDLAGPFKGILGSMGW